MNDAHRDMIDILEANGCPHPEKWIQYGLSQHFKRVPSHKLMQCPDCESLSLTPLGQYVYYSTIVRLQRCTRCGLAFSDTRIDTHLIHEHFEEAYKDETYFIYSRRRIFEQICDLVDYYACQRGKVLDIGGAKGHLLAKIRGKRPDLQVVLNDLSKVACDHGASQYGLETVCGGLNKLSSLSNRFDVVILSDVIYYEPELRKLWNVLPNLLSKGGNIIIRVPNRYRLIYLIQWVKRTFAGREHLAMQDHVSLFNPEHLYLFSRSYLVQRLKQLGCAYIEVIPSEILGDRIWHRIYYYGCLLLFHVSFKSVIITPSILVVAQYHGDKERLAH